jgi:hypothetical protein
MVIRRKRHAAMMETLTSATKAAICVVHSLDGAVVFEATVARDPAINCTALGAPAEASVGSEQLVDGRHRGSLAEPRVDLLDVGACEDTRASLFGDAHAA